MEILLSVRALARFDFLGRRKSNIGIAKLHNIIFLKKFISIIRLQLKLETGIKLLPILPILLPILETAADSGNCCWFCRFCCRFWKLLSILHGDSTASTFSSNFSTITSSKSTPRWRSYVQKSSKSSIYPTILVKIAAKTLLCCPFRISYKRSTHRISIFQQ